MPDVINTSARAASSWVRTHRKQLAFVICGLLVTMGGVVFAVRPEPLARAERRLVGTWHWTIGRAATDPETVGPAKLQVVRLAADRTLTIYPSKPGETALVRGQWKLRNGALQFEGVRVDQPGEPRWKRLWRAAKSDSSARWSIVDTRPDRIELESIVIGNPELLGMTMRSTLRRPPSPPLDRIADTAGGGGYQHAGRSRIR